MISIIVPVYNVEKYLEKCLNSIVEQTAKSLEIILVDDGSPDNCPKICDAYAEKDSRIKVVHKENGGLISARQAGVRAANGDYIGFVDADDWLEADMYSEVENRIEKYNPDIVICEFFHDFGDRVEINKQIAERVFYNKAEMVSEIYPKMLYQGTFYNFGINPSCWSKVIKKSLLEKHLYKVDTRIRMGEDAAFTYPCLLDAECMCYIDKPLYHYRIVKSSMSRGYDKSLKDIILLPYYRLKEANQSADFDISSQLDYYLIYMTNFLIRNEVKAFDNKRLKTVLRSITDNDEIVEAAKRISVSGLPMHTRLLKSFMKIRSTWLLYCYARLLGKLFMKG